MKLVAHIETTETEQPLVYEGTSPQEALDFLNAERAEMKIVTLQFITEVNGETRYLNRRVKGAACASVVADGKAWLIEIDPSLATPVEDGE